MPHHITPENLAELHRLLSAIAGGNIQGRWLDDEMGEAIDDSDDEDECPEGYVDARTTPDDEQPDMPRATWHPYDTNEQAAWVETCADCARAALALLPPSPTTRRPRPDPPTLAAGSASPCRLGRRITRPE